MLSKEKIQEVLFKNIFEPSTPDVANRIAHDLGLAPGSVTLGERIAPNKPAVISIVEKDVTHHVQFSEDGRSIVYVDPATI